MSIEQLIASYGYLALLVGTFLEGETVLIFAAIAAYQQYLTLPWVIVIAVVGSLMGDQFFFFMGRKKGRRFLDKRPGLSRRANKVYRLLEKNHTMVLLSFRFLYGLRNITPFVIGLSKIRTRRFVLLNLVGAVFWAASLGVLGYFFGRTAERIIRDVKHYHLEALAAIACAGLIFWLIYSRRQKSAKDRA